MVLVKNRQVDRERIAGALIIICLFVVIFTMVCIKSLDVKVQNIEYVDRGLYTVITKNGDINIDKNDILRIERTYTKASLTGVPVELDRIFTTKGFIYFTSLDPFYTTGCKLINSVDALETSVWIRPENSGTDETINQQQNANLQLVQPYSYAIGTPNRLSSLILGIVALQSYALALGGLALMILVFPLRLATVSTLQPLQQEESEYRSSDDQLEAVAK